MRTHFKYSVIIIIIIKLLKAIIRLPLYHDQCDAFTLGGRGRRFGTSKISFKAMMKS